MHRCPQQLSPMLALALSRALRLAPSSLRRQTPHSMPLARRHPCQHGQLRPWWVASWPPAFAAWSPHWGDVSSLSWFDWWGVAGGGPLIGRKSVRVCVCVFAVHRLHAEGGVAAARSNKKAASCVDTVVVQKRAGELCRMMPQGEEPGLLGIEMEGSPIGVVKKKQCTRQGAHPKSSCPKE